MNALRSVFALLLMFTPAIACPAVPSPAEVSVRQLLETPERFNGKRISVTGYFDTTEAHACDLRATKERPSDMRALVNLELSRPNDPAIKTLTRDYTRVVYVRVIGMFEYKKVGPINSKPVTGDPNVKAIITMQTGFGWMGLLDKQITNISVLTALPVPKTAHDSVNQR